LGLTRNRVLEITGVTRHQYYYQPKNSLKRGRKASTQTLKVQKDDVIKCTNEQVVQEISKQQANPDLACGYHKMTFVLMQKGYIINHKKVNRLMEENQLLLDKPKNKTKQYAKYRMVTPKNPLEVMEMDIKMIWCSEHRRHVYNLTIIDTFTRVALFWEVGYHMKKEQILRAWKMIIEHILQPAGRYQSDIHVEIRNDNGPQFSAKELRAFFLENGLNHIFTHPYTPQENGHVESFHAILSKAISNLAFWSISDVENRLEIFYENYNSNRIHSSIGNLQPTLFWQLWNQNKIKRIEISKRKIKFKLTFPYQQLSGNMNLREVPCLSFDDLDGNQTENKKVDELITLKNNHRSKNHHQLFPAVDKSMNEKLIFV